MPSFLSFLISILLGGYVYWKADTEDKDYITPLDIETTAYILSAILARGSRQDILEGSRIVRWLANQRSSRGGFKSTQVSLLTIFGVINVT